MEYIEYPKALYKDGFEQVVGDSAAEESARLDGFDDWRGDYDRMTQPPVVEDKPERAKPGPKPKPPVVEDKPERAKPGPKPKPPVVEE